ncbi:MAG: exodeoxyribonuclease VII small subunit [Blastocatellia bacterium]
MARTKANAQGFEESLAALERVVAQLEAGDLPLDSALEIFEDGVGLARRCQSQLAEAERKVEMLLREHGEVKVIPFDPSRTEQTDKGAKTAQPLRIEPPAENKQNVRQGRFGGPDAVDDDDDDLDDPVVDEFDDDDIPF